jgi:hypothetical protein
MIVRHEGIHPPSTTPPKSLTDMTVLVMLLASTEEMPPSRVLVILFRQNVSPRNGRPHDKGVYL